jgi:hypothetical protein
MVSMNFEFIEGGETGYKVAKFGGVRIADEEIFYYEGESGGVGVVAEEHEDTSIRTDSGEGRMAPRL